MNLHPIRLRDLPRLGWRFAVACIGVVLHLAWALLGLLGYLVRWAFRRRGEAE